MKIYVNILIKNTNKVIARAHASNDTNLYMLGASPAVQKVAANLASSPSQSININTLHRHLGHLGFDYCHIAMNHQLVEGIEKVVGSSVRDVHMGA